jgi:ribA/ribD-fused uncharacterized protein
MSRSDIRTETVKDLPLNIEDLRRAVAAGVSFKYRYCWGHRPRTDGVICDSVFSQWWPCRFEVDGRAYTSAEQFMMAGKARLFGDVETLATILRTEDPAACKALGRTVNDFDEKVWAAWRLDLVTQGNIEKFGQNESYRAHLLATGNDVLVEAAPRDQVWGIGLGRDNEKARDPRTWRGLNLLGFALMRTRKRLREAPPLTGVAAGHALQVALNDAALLLESAGEAWWSSKIRRMLEGSLDLAVILSWFGGMGSLGDRILSHENGDDIEVEQENAVNARLNALTTRIYGGAVQLQRESR